MESATPGDGKQGPESMAGGGARPAIDWDAAYAYFVSLSPEKRSLAAVAERFGVSVRTVETHSRKERWKERVRAISVETRARTADWVVEARVAEIVEMRRLIDASLVGYEEALRNGMRMSPVDLERLNRLSVALNEEASGAPQLGRDAAVEQPERSADHVRAVIGALAEAGVLETIGLTQLQPIPPDPSVDIEEANNEHD